MKQPSPPALHTRRTLRPTKHGGGTAEFVPDGRRRAQTVASRRVRRESTANRRSNRPRGDLRRAKVGDFGMFEELTALRAVAVPAARDGAERLATSCVTTTARGTRSQTAIPRRADAAVPALETCAAPVADSHFASDELTSAQHVAPRCARPGLTVARCKSAAVATCVAQK